MCSRPMRTGFPCAVAAACALVAGAQERAGQIAIVDRTSRATVYIKTEWSSAGEVIPASGSGFFVSPQGHVLTNHHVVASRDDDGEAARRGDRMVRSGPLLVVANSGTPAEKQLEGQPLSFDKESDLALLSTPFRPADWLEMAGSDAVMITQDAWAVGFPLGDMLALNKGNPEVTVSAVRVSSLRNDTSRALTAFQLEGSVNPGSSGGPIVDPEGRVLGVVRAGMPGNTGTALAIPPGVVRRFLDSNRFALVAEPRSLLPESTGVRLVATPRLSSIEGLTMSVSLPGSGSADPLASGLEKDGRIEVDLPLSTGITRNAGPKGLSFVATLRTAQGEEVAALTLAVPVAPRRTPLSPPTQATAVTTSGSATSPTTRAQTVDDAASQNRLARLASQIKLRPGASGASVTNADIGGWDYVPVEASFALLTPAERSAAQKLEGAIATCQAASREVTRLGEEGVVWASCEQILAMPLPTYSPWANNSYEQDRRARCSLLQSARKRREACATIDSLQAAVARAGVCRTPDHLWHRRDRALGTGCEIPRLESQ